IEFSAKRFRIFIAIVPQLWVHEASTRPWRRCAHGNMRHEDDVGAEQSCCSHVFYHVVIVADQDAAFPSFDIEHAVFITRCEIWIDERMKLSEFRDKSVFVYTDIRLEKISVRIFFEESCKHMNVMLCRDPLKLFNAFTSRNKFGEVEHL